MDEELIEQITEENIEVNAVEIVKSIVNVGDLKQSAEVEEEIMSIDVTPVEEIEINVEESIGWAGGDNTSHYSLSGRDEPNQHPIKAIIGLRDELDEIEALKTVYSDKIGVAHNYAWNDGEYTEFGYFVSLVPHTSTIAICSGADIFGVTVDSAGFIGGQDKSFPRNNKYALVVTNGLVDVRCESDVAEGDYVISNSYGIAEKTTSGCGYKVIAKENKNGIDYVSIPLGVQACVTDIMGKKLQHLNERMDDAESNIAATMSTANDAYNKAAESISSNESMSNQVTDALVKVDNIATDVENMSAQVSDIAAISAQSKAIAEGAVTSAESARSEAMTKANEALDKAVEIEQTVKPINNWEYTDPVTGETNTGAAYFAEYVKNGLSTKAEMETVIKLDEENKLLIEKNAESYAQMLSSVDKYSVGEYSQAYGLTVQQARNILKNGMVYIPAQHNGVNTHIETYVDGDSVVERSFTYGFYYIWTDNGLWSEAIGKVWFGTEPPAGATYIYWYDGSKLYKSNSNEWVEVAILAGNVNNRLASMIRQDINSITSEVVNARGNGTSLSQRLSNTDATIKSNAFWKNDDGSKYIASFQQKADIDGSSLALIAHRIDTSNGIEQDKSVALKGASIVLGQNEEDSYIKIDADRIDFKGGHVKFDATNINFAVGDYTIDADRIMINGSVSLTTKESESGATKIDGGNIATGTITTSQIAAETITADKIKVGAFGGFTIDETHIGIGKTSYNDTENNGVYISTAGIGLGKGKFYVTDEGFLHAVYGEIGNLTITDKLYFGGDKQYYIDANYDDRSYYINLPGLKVDERSGAVFSGELNAPSGNIGGCSIVNGVLDVPATNITGQLTAKQIDADNISAIGVDISGSFHSTGENNNTVDIQDGYVRLTQNWTNYTTEQIVSSTFNSFSNESISLDIGVNNNGYAIATISSGSNGVAFTSDNAQLSGTWLGTSSVAITSDINKKHDISYITESYEVLFDSLIPRIYKYDDGTSNRLHTGFIAQEVENAVETAGKTTQDFAGFVRAKLPNPETSTEEEICCLRYEEFIALNTWQIQKLKARVSELEKQIALLTEQ